MDQDLSFYLSFAGFSVGVLALICTLVLLFGRSGTRKILGWTFSLLILGTIVTVGIMWANEQRQQARLEQLAHEQQARQNDPIVTPAPTSSAPPSRGMITVVDPGQPQQFTLTPTPEAANQAAQAQRAQQHVQFDPSKPYEEFDPVTKQWRHHQGND